jgi:hypothetical protein
MGELHMGLLKEKYKVLAPRAAYLSDIVVLSQAWKKSHSYVRRHNWYQNTLELDCSAIDLEANLEKWSKAIRRGTYRPTPLRLVPAPKSALWTFTSGWNPQEADNSKRVLRPLAHLGIREQTVSTAVMLCLANCIETAQGDSSISDPIRARAANVYSYGNRLYCQWDDRLGAHSARFSWGNSDVYSRYYQDYKSFVNRPMAIAQSIEIEPAHGPIYVVKIDLSAFFDNIDVNELVNCLRREYASFRKGRKYLPAADGAFWSRAQSALSFEWDRRDQSMSHLLKDGLQPSGLPQGMVSSGFFANAYLLAFDRRIGGAVRRKTQIGKNKKITIHDYCRYVDDLRIVITASDETTSESDVANDVSIWIQKGLNESLRSERKLHINQDKTEVERYSSIGGSSGVVARMNAMQKELSGPFDTTTLAHVEAGLQGLLALAELGLQAKSDDLQVANNLSLSVVATPKLEVRDDTLTRFSAYRLTKALRLRRGMTDLKEEGEQGLARDALLHEFEVAARRLVAAWAVNPSLVQVLTYGLDLFPSPELLRPVTEALLSKLSNETSAFERHVSWYVLSELMRAGATHIGRRNAQDPGFAVGDLQGFRNHLIEISSELLRSQESPWYVRQQALLFMCAARKEAEFSSVEPELQLHLCLCDFIGEAFKARNVNGHDALSVALVGYQIHRDKKQFISWLRTYVAEKSHKEVSKAFELIGQTDSQLFSDITKSGKGKEAAKSGILPRYLGQYVDSRWTSKNDPLPKNTWIALSKVLTHPRNPLSQENALLQLLKGLASLASKPEHNPERFTPLTIELRTQDWGRLSDPRAFSLDVRYRPRRYGVDPRYATPLWCAPKYSWLYALGRVTRAAATGELDFTASHWVMRQDVGWYHGIKSSWQKRRSGMSQAPSALGGTTSGTTQWFSELLLRMLSWPGISSESHLLPEMDSLRGPADFLKVIEHRLKWQAGLYARGCDLPVYLHPVEWRVRSPRTLRVAILQGLMPRLADFDGGHSSLDEPGFRARHRNHLASVLHLAHRKIAASDSVHGDIHRPRVDIVVAPEYSVHVADQDLLRQFSDSLGAMLFYGLVGAKHPVDGACVNAARWLVPQYRGGKRSWVEVDQGKGNLTQAEIEMGVVPWRPYQAIIELNIDNNTKFRIAGAICYDATDIALAADLRNLSHMFVVPAMNRDVKTFDSMVAALRYHMYQHVIISNTGEFGGSTAQAPYDTEHMRLIAHSHGSNQIAVSILDVDIGHFGPLLLATQKQKNADGTVSSSIGKTPPAGLNRT